MKINGAVYLHTAKTPRMDKRSFNLYKTLGFGVGHDLGPINRKLVNSRMRTSVLTSSEFAVAFRTVLPGRSQRPCGIRRRSAAERLLGSWVRIPTGTWMFVWYNVCVVRYRSLRRADPSSRGVLPNVVCAWVWSSEKSRPLYTYCEQIGRSGKDHETKLCYCVCTSRRRSKIKYHKINRTGACNKACSNNVPE
jgi:hypothetical protein